MIVPSKVTPLDESIIGKMPHLIVEGVEYISISDLLSLRLKKFNDISEFILALDALYSLGRVDLDENGGLLRYVN